MSRSVRFAVYLLVGLAPTISACESAPTEVKQLVGEYRLTSINGSPLPITILTSAGESARVFEGNLQLQRDGKYLQVIHYSVYGGASNPHDTGRFEVQGSSLRFVSVDRPAYAGSLRDGQLTLAFDLWDADSDPEELTFTRN